MTPEPVAVKVVSLLKKKSLTLGTAESCTGGLIAKLITDVAGASQVFRGGVVAYTNEIKHKVLGVSQETLDTFGAVSPETARELSQGAANLLGCDIAIAVTGLAGPEQDEFGHTGGTVFVSLCCQEKTDVREFHLGTDRHQVRTETARIALEWVREAVESV